MNQRMNLIQQSLYPASTTSMTIRHEHGDTSRIDFKPFDGKSEVWQSDKRDLIWFDSEDD